MTFMGQLVRSLRGNAGTIAVPGLGAVVAEFHTWTLQRREDNGSGPPTWDLHAVFRYHNDLLLLNDDLKKKMTCTLNKDREILLCGWEELEVEGDRLIAKGVVQCPQT